MGTSRGVYVSLQVADRFERTCPYVITAATLMPNTEATSRQDTTLIGTPVPHTAHTGWPALQHYSRGVQALVLCPTHTATAAAVYSSAAAVD